MDFLKSILRQASDFIKSMLGESDGSISTTRVCIVMIFSYVIGSGITLICKLHTPVSVQDICTFLSSAGTFIATTCGPLYLINKGADVIGSKTDSTKQ